jgi:hypothetical protein
MRRRHHVAVRDWFMDSGAFSAWNSGKQIDLQQYTETCKELLATDPRLTEVAALDVIGDWRASLRNTERMWEAGVPAVPAFHLEEPEDVLVHLANTYPKIALGGATGRARMEWARQCFARVWPKAIHGFGFGVPELAMELPWHSVDCTTWMVSNRFGRYAYTRQSVRCPPKDVTRIGVTSEVRFFLELERKLQQRWAPALAQLDYTPLRVAA